MIWITKLISKQDSDTQKEALDKAIALIDNWCKENGFKYEIKHNSDTGCNRVLYINCPRQRLAFEEESKDGVYYKTYIYKFIISVFAKPTGEYEESKNLFGKKWLVEKNKNAYYAHLDK